MSPSRVQVWRLQSDGRLVASGCFPKWRERQDPPVGAVRLDSKQLDSSRSIPKTRKQKEHSLPALWEAIERSLPQEPPACLQRLRNASVPPYIHGPPWRARKEVRRRSE